MFLDTGVVSDALEGKQEAVRLLENESQIFMSTVSIREYLEGRIRNGATDVHAEMDRLSGVNWQPLTERVAIRSGSLQLELEQTGDRMSQRDLMIAATALEVGDELIVTDSDFQVPALEKRVSVTNLRN